MFVSIRNYQADTTEADHLREIKKDFFRSPQRIFAIANQIMEQAQSSNRMNLIQLYYSVT